MRKIIITSLVLKKHLNKFVYKVDGDSSIEYAQEVYFPVNGVLAKKLKKGDDVKVVLLKTLDAEHNSDVNEQIFKNELNTINKSIGANIEYTTIATPFHETRATHEKLLQAMIGELEDDIHIIADITFGPKPEAIAIFMVLKFAEKFYDANIEDIVYGKVDFRTLEDGRTVPENPVLYNLTPLFYLNSIFDNIDSDTPVEKVVNTLDKLLDM